jgi:hypothetical protein
MTIALNEVWAKAFSPPDRRSIIDWAKEKVTLPPVLAKSGRFDVAESRHFIGPLQAIRHDRVRGVRILAPVRGGKTLIVDVSVPWAIANDNASVLWVMQDKDIASDHAETRQMPILKSVPEIRPLLSADRHKTRKSDILFANGLPFKLTGPALGKLQSKGFKWLICDEPWLYKPGKLLEAKARMGDFVKLKSNKFIALSQGGEEDGDWDVEYRAGVEFIWRPRCVATGCRQHMPIEWTLTRPDGTFAGAVFDTIKREDGTYIVDACAATVRYVCPHCGHAHPNTQRTRRQWNDDGDYFNAHTGERFDPENPPTEVSFRFHALIDYPWEELVKEWLAAQDAKRVGNFVPLVKFFQKRCALMRSERTVHDSDLPFARIALEMTKPTDKAWPGEHMRFLTADRQEEDEYWVLIRAWGRGTGESRRVWFGRLFSEADIEAKRIEYGVPKSCVVIDSGYRSKGDTGVYAMCIRYGWIAAKGDDAPFFWHTVKLKDGKSERVQRSWAPASFGEPGGSGENGKKRCALIRFSAPTMADRVMGLVDRGLWVEPAIEEADELERDYRRQMTAEFKRPKVNKLTGRREMIWVCPSGNNHAFDCSKMQVLCAMQAKLLPSGIELSAPKEPVEKEEEEAA